MSGHLTIVRGLPGTGKSTYAKTLAVDAVYEADQFFVRDGEYKFDPSRLRSAHEWCRTQVLRALRDGLSVAVANTFTQAWEMQPYLDMGYPVDVVAMPHDQFTDEQLAERNIHGVPVEAIKRMRERWEA